MNAWDTLDGAKAIKLLGKERLLDDLTLLNRAFGEAKKKHPKLPWGIAQEGIRRCILRDAARVFLEKRFDKLWCSHAKLDAGNSHWYIFGVNGGVDHHSASSHDYDAALIVAVLAAGKERT